MIRTPAQRAQDRNLAATAVALTDAYAEAEAGGDEAWVTENIRYYREQLQRLQNAAGRA